MKHGFIKVAAATPKITVADPSSNVAEIIKLHKKAEDLGAAIAVFPELCLTGATCGDLFTSEALYLACEKAIGDFLAATKGSYTISIIGFPLIVNEKIYNSVAICQKGQILAINPKSSLCEGWERRVFCGFEGEFSSARICGVDVPVSSDPLLVCENMRSLKLTVRIGKDASAVQRTGALILANPAAYYETVGASEYRESFAKVLSAESKCGYILACAGEGESTTDYVFGGQKIIAECGDILAESIPFSGAELTISEIDVSRISQDRKRDVSYKTQNGSPIYFDYPVADTNITRFIDPHPFVPADPTELARRCERILSIQAQGLATRIVKAYAKKCVIGISGGLDSCLALLVAVRAMDLLNRPRTDVVCVTMPCFGTTKRTRSNAELLCDELGCGVRCVDIADAVKQHFSDIGHDESIKNVVYENSQARERTQVIMDIANIEGGFVVGTGDLSELALGWATYNGDHMSMYGVNADVPKTLVREIVSYCARKAADEGKSELSRVLTDIVDTPVSPELLPADEGGNIAQKTEDLVGPYEIHDFYIYNTLRFGYTPDKLYRLAKIAFEGVYDEATLKKWLINFVRRFFSQQFKRSCLPDGPKVGSVGLSPRGDWQAPSDGSSSEWLKIAEHL